MHIVKPTDTCTFCNIAAGTKPAAVVFDHPQTIAFLDKRPLIPGHVLVIPRNHVADFTDLPDSIIAILFSHIKLISCAVEKAMEADGSFIFINNKIGQSIPHLHIHVVPRKRKDGFKGFFWPRRAYKSEDEIYEIRMKILMAMESDI